MVLPDLGSSVPTARPALRDHAGTHALIADAPFVEGAVAAALTAAGGTGLSTVVRAAENAQTSLRETTLEAGPGCCVE